MRLGDTPVPISNTMVKTWSADGTILETVWESRWMPLHCFLIEDERKRSLRLENKHTLRSAAKQWCFHKTLDESERSLSLGENLIIRAYSSAG